MGAADVLTSAMGLTIVSEIGQANHFEYGAMKASVTASRHHFTIRLCY